MKTNSTLKAKRFSGQRAICRLAESARLGIFRPSTPAAKTPNTTHNMNARETRRYDMLGGVQTFG